MDEPARAHPSVLLITRNLPPLRGGMERLVQHVAQSLADDYDLSVVGPEGCSAYLPQQAHMRDNAEMAVSTSEREGWSSSCATMPKPQASRSSFGS